MNAQSDLTSAISLPLAAILQDPIHVIVEQDFLGMAT
jgi:hypothetical protein